ncbi:6-phospho-beta-glucosidase [Candidatus Stoquefichus massiliensis]|uniref:6-phospho-beta-glucosidase n=1 Tax=Candidatus Stoquefichus massiliensis TaxID=1470350 RepID=UPI000488F841|nr:6-phospho-beta-glucosidase [Candidatus Stoquefichus massiliensis]
MNKELKIVIVGAGSSYTPELIEGLSEHRDVLPVKEIVLVDIDEDRLKIMDGFVHRYCHHLDYHVSIASTTSREEAFPGADFIACQIRVGGNKQRIYDEKIPLKYGVIGQETTGVGGMFNALRTIPVMIDIAKDVEKYCPDAWIVNYSNPTGLVTEAVLKVCDVNMAGLCAGGMRPRWWAEEALQVPEESIYYDYIGLNHMNFTYNMTVDGKPITDEQFSLVAKKCATVSQDLIQTLHLIPSQYTQYYFHTSKILSQLKSQDKTRGEAILELEKQIWREYSNPENSSKPKTLAKRGGGGYSKIAVGVMEAVYNDSGKWMVINVPNNGTIRFLNDDAVIETACFVSRDGIKPLNLRDYPQSVCGLIAAVKNYESLTVEAALSGDYNIALKAMLAHPLVREYDIAKPLLDEMLEVHKDYLPQFFKNDR